jgi:hypothetical protein
MPDIFTEMYSLINDSYLRRCKDVTSNVSMNI